MKSTFDKSESLAQILAKEFDRRYKRNKAYSYRAFARDLGVSRSYLSDILKEKNGISYPVAQKVGQALEFTEAETDLLFAFSEKDFARTGAKKTAAQQLIRERTNPRHGQRFDVDVFDTISDWYHFAILEMSLLQNFELSDSFISKALGIKRELIEPALQRVARLGLAKIQEGKLLAIKAVSLGDTTPSEAIRSFHKQILKKAATAVEKQTPDRRLLSSNFVALSATDLPKARKMVGDFVDQFNREFDESYPKDSLYCLSLQLFDLMQTPKGNNA